MNPIQHFLQKPWLYLIIVLMGVSLKFYHLNHRLFWYDEICTIQHTSGIPLNKYSEFIPINEITSFSVYDSLLHLSTQNQTIGSQIKGLFSSTNLTPMHYPFLMIWYRIVGDNPIHYRLFSVFIFILVIPFLFLLARTLFESDLAGWITISLYAVSPMFQYYAQESRYMILMAFFLIVLNYLFLKVIQKNRLKWWIAYSLIGIMAMYTSVLSGIVLFGHFIYILIFNKELRKNYSISLFAILLVYLPWICSIFIHRNEIISSLAWHSYFFKNKFPWDPLIRQIMGFSRTFMFLTDMKPLAEIALQYKYQGNYVVILSDIVVFTLIISSIIYVFRKSSAKVSSFLALIFFPQFLFFYLTDIIRNSGGSALWRYHTIMYIALLLYMSFLISRKIASNRLFYLTLFLGLILTGLASIFTITKTRCLWISGSKCQSVIKSAKLISEADSPLIITDYSSLYGDNLGGFLEMLTECSSKNIDILRASPDIENVIEILDDKEYSEIYVVSASDELVRNLKLQFGERMDLLEVEIITQIWQINFK